MSYAVLKKGTLYAIPIWSNKSEDAIRIKCREDALVEVYFPSHYQTITEEELTKKGISLSKHLTKIINFPQYVRTRP